MRAQKGKVVVILGSGRSGTSLAMHLAHEFGQCDSESLTPIGDQKSRKRTWEDPDISFASREILRHFHRHSWKLSYLPMPDDWLSDSFVKHQKAFLKGVVTDRLSASKGALWGFKNPLTVKLLPLWKSIFEELSLKPIYILCFRNPVYAKKSYKTAYGASERLARLVWLSMYNDAIIHTGGDFTVLEYDLWLDAPEEQATLFAKALGIEVEYDRVNAIVKNTIDPALRKSNLATDNTNYHLSIALYSALNIYQNNHDYHALTQKNDEVTKYLERLDDVSLSVDFVVDELENTKSRLKNLITIHNIPTPLDREFINKRKQLKPIKNKIVGGVASFEKRIEVFEAVVSSILPQLDLLIVFLNNYESIPDYLNHSKILVYRSQEYEDLSANGKIFYLDKLESCYFFSLDDDIKYPSDYVDTMIECLDKYNNQVCVSVHGSIFPETLNWYYERYTLYPFGRALEHDTFVSLIGSGTFAFHTDTLKSTFSDFYTHVMVDLKFSILAREQGVPLVCIARSEKWLVPLVKGDGLYQRFLESRTIHTTESLKYNPWGYESFRPMIQSVIEDVFPELNDQTIKRLRLDKEFIDSFKTDFPPNNWKESELYRQKVRHRKVVMNPIETLKEKNKEIDDLRGSTAFKIGTILVNAFSKPGKNSLLLPYHLLQTLFRSKDTN